MNYLSRLIHTSVLTSFSVTAVSGWYNAAHANPLEGQIAAGSANIVNTVGRTDIQQHSERVVIDWRSFDVAEGETTQFHQPGASSIAVNRINDTKASQINGNLIANGNILLLNQNGVMFGRGANVDVGGIVASTSGLEDDQQFMQGGAIKLNRPGNADAKIVNQGKISAKQAGLVGLVAPQVENSGIISANVGKVQLASGDTYTLDFAGDGITNIAVTGNMREQMVANSGIISANGGVVQMTAAAARDTVNSLVVNTGTIEAKSVGTKNGKIILSAEGSNGTAKTGNSVVLNSGKLDASGKGAGETGGEVQMLADNVGVLSGAEIDARGTNGGGTVLVGGEYQGQGATQKAKRTVVQNNTTIDASAIENGDGGRVIVWADDRTDFHGLILAKGGAISGDGGFVETSGKNLLNVGGLVDASSVHGQMGQWLLDPNNVIIQTAGVDTNVTGGPNFTTTDDSAIVTTGSIETALNAGTSVTITTSNLGGNSQAGNITVNNNITKSSGGAATLSLIAHNDIILNGVSIVANGTSAALNLILNSDSDASGVGAISITNSTITTNGGNIIMGGGADPTTTAAIGTAANKFGVSLVSATLNSGAGNISIRGEGQNNTGANNNYGVSFTGGGAGISATSGNITIVGQGGNGGYGGYGVSLYNGYAAISTTTGDITITGTGAAANYQNTGLEIGNGIDIISAGGLITLTGTGGGGVGSWGVTHSFYDIRNTTGNIIINANSNSWGGFYNDYLGRVYTTSGQLIINANSVSLAGTSGANIGDAGMSGNITFNTDSMSHSGGAITTTGNVYFNPLTASRTIGLGNGAGDLNLSESLLQAIAAANVYVGNGTTNTGLITVGAADLHTKSYALLLRATSGDIKFDMNGGTFYTTTANFQTSTTTGDLTTGSAGTLYGSSSSSLWLESGSDILFSHDFDLYLNGFAGAVFLGANDNIVYTNGGDITTLGGYVTLQGNRGGAAGGAVSLGSGSVITTNNGQVVLAGQGTASYVSGVAMNGNIDVGGGVVNITGTGYSGGGSNNTGVAIAGNINAGWSLDITGTGGNTGGDNNFGVAITGGTISTTGNAAINITGTGGGSHDYEHGVWIYNVSGGVNINSVNGAINITGAGSTGSAGGYNNYGVYMAGSGNSISTSGSGNININGTGGTGSGGYNYGIAHGLVDGMLAVTASGTGNITYTGAGGTGSTSTGVLVSASSPITANTGAITLRSNDNIVIQNSSSVTTSGGAIVLNSDRDNSGDGAIYMANSSLASNNGNITLGGGLDPTLEAAMGSAGSASGIHLALASINSGTGTITMRGQGDTTNAGNGNHGIYINRSSVTASGAGTVTLYGQGGGAVNSEVNFGVYLYDTGTLSTASGAINVTAVGGGGAGGSINHGLQMDVGNILSTSGAINVTGTGGNAGGLYHSVGAYLGGNSLISTGGNISLIGTGASGGAASQGIYADWARITGTGTGSILLRGTANNNYYGVHLSNGSANAINITNQGGSITLESPQSIYTAGTTITSNGGAIVFNSDTDANSNGAINLAGNNTITSGGGNVTLGGGAGAAASAYGMSVANIGVSIQGTTINTGAGALTMRGHGRDNGGGGDVGVSIGSNSTIVTTSGAIDITGRGGDNASGAGNAGFTIFWATMNTTSGNITISGTGGNNAYYDNDGVYIGSSGAVSTSVQSVSGNINITGTAGEATRYDDGVVIGNGGQGVFVRTTGAGNVTITGYGGVGAGESGNSHGVVAWDSGTASVIGSTGSGNVTISGTAGIGGNDNYGTQITDNAQVVANGGTIGITGTGNTGNTVSGLYISGDVVNSGAGIITLTGNTGTTGITLATGSDITNQNAHINLVTTGNIRSAGNITSNNGNINIGDDVTLTGATNWNAGTGSLTLAGTVNGTYDFTLNADTISFGGDLGGSTALDDVSITTAGALTLPSITAGTIFARTTGATSDITIDTGKTLTASGTGNAIVLASGDDFINNSNASALDADNGRWIIYSNRRGDDTTGGLTPVQEIGGQTYGTLAPGSVPNATQNSWIYANTLGTISIIANAISGVFGGLIPTYTYSFSCSDGCLSSVLSGALTSVVGNAGDTITSNVGTYGITIGSLAASNGYQINYTGANLTVTPASLTVTATAGQNKTYGAADPGAYAYTYTGLVNGDLTANFTGALSRAVGENVGNYAINQNNLAATGNYTITTYNSNNFVINPYALTVTANAGQSKTYGASNPTYTYTYGALQNGDTAAVLSGALDRAAGENVGNYAINQGTFSAGSNYTINFVSNNFAINPYTLNVSADAMSKIYGNADPTLTYTYGTLQNGDNASIFSGALARVAGETVLGGPYAISQGTLSAGSNYTVNFTGNNLSITPRALTVVTDAKSKLLVDADPVFTGSNNLIAGDVGLVSWAYAPQGYAGAVGAYTITATATDPSSVLSNYTRTNNYGTFSVVDPAMLMPNTVRWRMNTVDDIVVKSTPPTITPSDVTTTPVFGAEIQHEPLSKESYENFEPATGGSPFESIDMSIFYDPYENVIRLRPRTRTKYSSLD